MITAGYITSVIEKLEVWREHDFHGDRQLADEVLIADGWKVVPAADWKGGIRWWLPGNPEISVGENGRAHPVYDLNAALGVVPLRHNVRIEIFPSTEETIAHVWCGNDPNDLYGDAHKGVSSLTTVAVLIAALKAKRELIGAS